MTNGTEPSNGVIRTATSDNTTDTILKILEGNLRGQSVERREQTKAYLDAMAKQTEVFDQGLRGLRMELRALLLLTIVIMGALAGVNVYYESKGMTVSATQADSALHATGAAKP